MKPKEGAFYVWTVKEVQQLLPEPVGGASEPLTSGQLLMKHYGLTEAGNISSTQVRTSGAHKRRTPRPTKCMGSFLIKVVFLRSPKGNCTVRMF